MFASKEEAEKVVEDLRARALAMPTNRAQGKHRVSLYRAMTTIEWLYGIGDFSDDEEGDEG